MSIDATKFIWKLSKDVVSPIEKLILLAIADRCGERGECWPSISRLEKDTGIVRRAIITHRNKLIDQGILRFTGEYKGRSKQIPVMQLMIDDWREGEYVEDEIDQCTPCTGAPDAHVPVHEMHTYQCTPCTQNLKEETKEESIKNTKQKNEIVPVEYSETYYPMKKENSKSKKLTIDELKVSNPHQIPTQMIEDWMANRKEKKLPLTPTVWHRLTKELARCLNPIEAFEEMVASGWQGFKAEWVDKPKQKKSHFDNESTDWANDIEKDIF